MDNQELSRQLSESFPSVSIEEGGEWPVLSIKATELRQIALTLRVSPLLKFDYLFCLTCIDWKDAFVLVYHFHSTDFRHSLVLKTKLDRSAPEIATLSDIWRTAEFHEREVYDLFGVRFLDHPDLRRLFMPDDWKGWPLRKDYEDPVNMIKL